MLQLLLLGFLTAGQSWSLRLQCPDLSMEQAKDSDGNQMYGDYEVQQTRENQDQNPRDQRHKGRECNKHTKATGTFVRKTDGTYAENIREQCTPSEHWKTRVCSPGLRKLRKAFVQRRAIIRIHSTE